jgi:hypothetical protein
MCAVSGLNFRALAKGSYPLIFSFVFRSTIYSIHASKNAKVLLKTYLPIPAWVGWYNKKVNRQKSLDDQRRRPWATSPFPMNCI